ncbi:MAG: tetratricopeptide repeat protein, partial [Minisyncoccia bacterium]
KDYEGYYNRAFTYRAMSDYDKAIADFSRAIELAPTNPWAYLEPVPKVAVLQFQFGSATRLRPVQQQSAPRARFQATPTPFAATSLA